MTLRRPDSKLVASKRPDRRGHWPAGKPRHPTPSAVLRRLKAARTHMTYRQIAAAIGCDPRTAQRWASGARNVTPEYQALIMQRL